MRGTAEAVIEAAYAYHRTDVDNHLKFADWLAQYFHEDGTGLHPPGDQPEPEISPELSAFLSLVRQPDPPGDEIGPRATRQQVLDCQSWVRPIDGVIQELTGTSLMNGPLEAVSGEWVELARISAGYSCAAEIERSILDGCSFCVTDVRNNHWDGDASDAFQTNTQGQIDQMQEQASIGKNTGELLGRTSELARKPTQDMVDMINNRLDLSWEIGIVGLRIYEWIEKVFDLEDILPAFLRHLIDKIKHKVKAFCQSIVDDAKKYEDTVRDVVKTAHEQLRATEALLTGDEAWKDGGGAPGSATDPEAVYDNDADGPKIKSVEAVPGIGPDGQPTTDAIGGDTVYPGPPPVEGADLGVPVPMGKDKDGGERFIFIMGDTQGKYKDPKNKVGMQDDRVGENPVLMAHKDPATGKMVYDGFMTEKDPATGKDRLVNLLPPSAVGGYPHRGANASLVPTSATMANGKLVVAYQKVCWSQLNPDGSAKLDGNNHSIDLPGGQWKVDGTYIAQYDIDPNDHSHPVKVPDGGHQNVVEIKESGFQQVQLTTHKENGRDELYVVGCGEGRVNDGPHLAKVPADQLMATDGEGHPTQWQYYNGNHDGAADWGAPGAPPQPHTIPGFPNVGEGSTKAVGDHLVMVYTDGAPGHGGVYMRTAPLSNPDAFGPPQPVVAGDPPPGQKGGPVDGHYAESGGSYGGFIQEVAPDGKSMIVMVSRWAPYGVYPVRVNLA